MKKAIKLLSLLTGITVLIKVFSYCLTAIKPDGVDDPYISCYNDYHYPHEKYQGENHLRPRFLK